MGKECYLREETTIEIFQRCNDLFATLTRSSPGVLGFQGIGGNGKVCCYLFYFALFFEFWLASWERVDSILIDNLGSTVNREMRRKGAPARSFRYFYTLAPLTSLFREQAGSIHV